jgi:hypothetical protein
MVDDEQRRDALHPVTAGDLWRLIDAHHDQLHLAPG